MQQLTMMNKFQSFNISIPRRKYFSDNNLTICPECESDLIEENCTISLHAKSNTDDGEFMTNMSGSRFCKKCPVVIFDVNSIELAVKLGIKGDKNLRYSVLGIVDLERIPDDKKHLEIGTDENPVTLVHFLPELDKTVTVDKKPGRNEICYCGSGKKYKKCCAK